MTDLVTVRTRDGQNYVLAKVLTYADGTPVTSTNVENKSYQVFDTSPNHNLIGTNAEGYVYVPATFDIQTAVDFGATLRLTSLLSPGLSTAVSGAAMVAAFWPGTGFLDIQTHYNGEVGGNVPLFRAGASVVFGAVGAAANYPLAELMAGGGFVNLFQSLDPKNKIDLSGTAFNNPLNVESMKTGYNTQLNGGFSSSAQQGSFNHSESQDGSGGVTGTATIGSPGTDPLTFQYTGDPTSLDFKVVRSNPDNSVSTFQVVSGNLANISETTVGGDTVSTALDYMKTQSWSSQTLVNDINGYLKFQQDVLDSGDSLVKFYDPRNTHPYNQLNVTQGADNKVTAAQVVLDPNIIAAGASVGQIFGSALGGALGGNALVGSVVGGTVGSLIGQKFIQVLATSMTADLSQVSVADVFAGQGINIAGAGIGAVSSFLTAELGTALHIGGFGGQLFNIAGSSLTFSVLSQVANSNLSFDAAIAAIDWSQAVSGAFNTASLNIDGVLGGYLAHEFVPAKTHEGAVGGELLGAIGNLILPGGLGSFIGTILGTLIFNRFGTSPSPGAVDLLDQAGNLYGFREYQSSDHGTYDFPDKMAPAADAIINAYLHAVNGVALDHSKQVTIGYIVNPDLLFISGVPGHTDHSFTNADDAVHAAALDVLQNTEVIGGDLLLKRAHHNSPSNDPQKAPGGGGLPGQPQFSAAEQLVTMSGDLSVAQDYETYLNNREAINALIAANPDSAFTAGWIATFARVQDLKLNQVGASDFLGGLVGYLDSVNKAGLGPEAANASVKPGSGSSIVVEVRVANGVDVPGALSVFADQTNISSDATGQTVQFVFSGGLGGLGGVGFDTRAAGASGGDGGNDLWFGNAGAANNFTGTGGHDILVGGAANDVIHGGGGFDFIDGGAGNDTLFGEDGNDILRGGTGNDNVQGGAGNDTYVFNRGDGADTVYDDYRPLVVPAGGGGGGGGLGGGIAGGLGGGTPVPTPTDGGQDTLAFGAGISPSDIRVAGSGNNLIVTVRDPANPAAGDAITLQDWTIQFNRIETFVFADGTTLNVGAALGAYQVPFGESLSHNSIAENSANGAVVGTVTGYDFDASAILNYALLDSAGGRFAINSSNGAVTVANGLLLDYESGAGYGITVRTADQAGHVFDKSFAIAVTDVYEAPSGATLSGNTVVENSANGTPVGTVAGVDADPHAILSYALTDNAGGRFAINASTGAVTVANGLLLDYESATSHQVTVRITDQAGHAFDKAFTLAVTNFNETPTDERLIGDAVAENSPNGFVVGTVTGIDPDAGTVFKYSLIDDAGGRFSINADAGLLTVADGSRLDYEAANSHRIVVHAEDQGHLSVDRAFTLAVTNVNETPTDERLSGNAIAENSPNGAVVGTVTGIDPDAGTVFKYSLSNDAGGRFSINADTGQLTVADGSRLDYETASAHVIEVHAEDQGHLSVDRAFTIAVIDVPGLVLNGDGGANTLIGSAENDTINGLGGNDVLIGAAGNDAIDGGADADAMVGGAGDDTYVVDNAGDAVIENAGEGTDTVQSSISTTLSANVENLTLTGAAPISGSGNAAGNVITGNSGDNILTGLGGADTIYGGAGFDTAVFSGNRADYAISYHAGTQSFTIADQRAGSPDGSDTVNGVEIFQFADGAAEYDPQGRLAKWTVLSGDGALSVTQYDADQSRPWATYTSTFNNLGQLAGLNVSYDDGSSAITHYDATDITPWSSQTGAGGPGTHSVAIADTADAFEWAAYTNVIDGSGSLVSQAGTLDNGAHWLNVYDTAGAFAWSNYFNVYDPNTHVIWQSGTQDNGTHWLTVLDANGSYSWTQATIAFDAGWNIMALGGINDDGSHLIAPGEFSQIYDTLAWSPSAYIPAQHLSPQGQLWGGTVEENAPFGRTVGIVAGALTDGGTVLNFALTDPAGGPFAIDAATGIVTVANGAQLDYESATSQAITVRTTDASGAVRDSVFTIAITDVPEAPTNLTLSSTTVMEHSRSQTVIGTLTGVDPDAGAVFHYTLAEDPSGLFQIKPGSNVLETAGNWQALDYATAASHMVKVSVTDETGLSYSASLNIAVTPDHVTTINNGTTTTTIYDAPDVYSWNSFRTDQDANGNVTYQLGINDGGSSWQNVFDTAHMFSWDHRTSAYDAGGHLVSQTTTNHDDTHVLVANDPANVYGWSTFTMTFDADWNYLSTNVTNDDGTHTPDMGQIWASMDTLTWYPKPYTVSPAQPVNGAADGMPVVLDLDGNGIDIVQLGASSASFDMDGEAGREHTAWAGAGDGFLAIDLGADGKPGPDGVIDQAKEIVFTQWSPGATSDMAALRAMFDTNHNGLLDRGDARWSEFRVWQDADGDGFSRPGEVKTLDALGFASIGLDPTGPSQNFSDGSAIHGLSSFTRADGAMGTAGDVALSYQIDADHVLAAIHNDWHVA
jgi:Ca2+-binding RTX toxin-like protein